MARVHVKALIAAVLTAGLCGGLVACSDDKETLDYAIDGSVRSYNTLTAEGAADGAIMALARVLPGFSYYDSQGQLVSDSDIGSVTADPAGTTLTYTINPKAQYSDGAPLTCDALVLAWIANSGRYQQFQAATSAGYRLIDTVSCQPGAKKAVVTLLSPYANWRALFGVGALLPPQTVSSLAQVPQLVPALTAKPTPAVVDKVAQAWNTGFALTPGHVGDIPTLGPYRVAGYDTQHGLHLTRNDKWWATPATTADITIWTRNAGAAEHLGSAEVTDTATRALSDTAEAGAQQVTSLAAEELTFAAHGPLGSEKARQAVAHCVPRSDLAKKLEAGPVTNLRAVASTDLIATTINKEVGTDYARPDVAAAKKLAPRGLTLRIGYAAPNPRLKDAVATLAAACGPAGIAVKDVSSPDFSVTALTGANPAVDATFLADGSAAAAGVAADGDRGYRLLANFPALATQLNVVANDTDATERLQAGRELERTLWVQMPTVPLAAPARSVHIAGAVSEATPSSAVTGTGWNMDRWTLAN